MRHLGTGFKDYLYMIIFAPVYWVLSKNAKQGAQTTLYTIYEDREKLVSGGYYSDCALKAPSNEANNP